MAAVIVVALAVPAGLALRTIWGQGGDDDVHERLVDALDELDVGDLILVAEQQFGVSDCVLGDCPRVDRYYASPRGVSETCEVVTAAVAAWAPGATPTGRPGCELEGRTAGAHLSVSVRDTIDIEPEHDQVDLPELDVPHESVVVIGLTADR